MKVKARQSFTLEAVQDGMATVRLATQILTPIDEPAIEAKLVQRQPGGTMKFDIEAGRVISQQMDTDKRVIGFRGGASSLHYRTRFTEDILGDAPPASPAVASAKEKDRPSDEPQATKPSPAPAAATPKEKPDPVETTKSARRPKPVQSSSLK
jgi:hypothetical protein